MTGASGTSEVCDNKNWFERADSVSAKNHTTEYDVEKPA